MSQAVKERQELRSSVLRLLMAVVLNKEKEKRYKISKIKPGTPECDLIEESQLDDEEITEIIFSEIKKRKEAISEYEKGKRMELAEKEKKELEILREYLPEQRNEKKN